MWLREHASVLRWAGIALSMVGVLIVFSGADAQSGSASLLGNVLMFVIGGAVGRVHVDGEAGRERTIRVQVTAGIIGAGAVMLLPLAAFRNRGRRACRASTCEAGSAWRISAPAHPASPTCCTAPR